MANPNTTKKKVPLVYPLSTPVMGVDEKFDFFPAGSGLRRCRAPERRNPTKTWVVPYHMCTSVLGIVDGQDPTPGCDRHHFLPTEFLDLYLETPPSGELEGIL